MRASRRWLVHGFLVLAPLVKGLAGCGGSEPAAQSPGSDSSAGKGPDSDCGTEPVCSSRCDAHDAAACEWLGRMHETGEGAAQDYQRAADLYGRACDEGRADSCVHLATMYDIGLAVGESPERAEQLYHKACAQGNRWACRREGQLQH